MYFPFISELWAQYGLIIWVQLVILAELDLIPRQIILTSATRKEEDNGAS